MKQFLHITLGFLCLVFTTNEIKAQIFNNWMEQSVNIIKDIPLNRLVIPGAHDSGTYQLETNLRLAPDALNGSFHDMLYKGGAPFCWGWAKTQELSIYEQLNSGIRYLDLRVCMDGDVIKFCHTYYGANYKQIFSDVRKFIDENPKEVVILGFNHFWDYDFQKQYGLKRGENKSEGLTDKHLTKLIDLINEKFKNRIAPYWDEDEKTGFNAESSLNDLWSGNNSKQRNQVILLFNKTKFNSISTKSLVNDRVSFWWSQEEDTYFNEQDRKTFLKKTDKELDKSHDKFAALRSCVTPSNTMYGMTLDFGSTYPENLKELADDTNPVVLNHLMKSNSKDVKNLIWADFVNKTDLVKLALYLNGIKKIKAENYKYFSIKPSFNPKESNWGNWKSSPELFLEAMFLPVNIARDYVGGIANQAVEWVDGLFSNSKVKANPPSNGVPVSNIPNEINHYRIHLNKIKVINAGAEDIAGKKALELYGAINVIPNGNLYVNQGANKYLWHKSSDQKKSIKEKSSIKPNIYKDFYGLESDITTNILSINVNLKEKDTGSDDKMKKSFAVVLHELSLLKVKNYTTTVKNGDQKVTVYFTIERM